VREIKILNNYSYLPDHNLFINKETLKSYSQYLNENQLKIGDPLIKSESCIHSTNKIQQVILQVTKDCNQRCKYCAYNNNSSSEWNLSSEYMNFDVAKRALEYFYTLIEDRLEKKFAIGFYGGEPILALDLIKRIVSYSKILFNNWELEYYLTTNGTLIHDEILDYLIKENFEITLSLDGPQKNHDEEGIRGQVSKLNIDNTFGQR
jgi:uncharacterized protein